jgi:hypothetical protein
MPTPANDPVSNLSAPVIPPIPADIVRRPSRVLYFGLGLVIGAGALAGLWLLIPSLSVGHDSAPQIRALLRVARPTPTLLGRHASQSPMSDSEWDSLQANQLALVKSRLVLNDALHRLLRQAAESKLDRNNLAPMASIAWLEKDLQVDFVGKSGILRIGLSSGDPKERVAVVNAVAHAYLDEVTQLFRKKQDNDLEKLKGLAGRLTDDLRRRREELRELQKVAGNPDPAAHVNWQSFEKEYRTALARELVRVRLGKIDVEARLFLASVSPKVKPVSRRGYAADALTAAGLTTFGAHGPLPLVMRFAAICEALLPDKEAKALVWDLENEKALLDDKQGRLLASLTDLKPKTERIQNNAPEVDVIKDSLALLEKTLNKIFTRVVELELEKEAGPPITLMEEASADQAG